MKRVIVAAALVAGIGLGASAGLADAAKPDNPGAGGRCVAEGVAVLRSLPGGVSAAARQQVDYGPFGPEGAGLIRLPIPAEGVFLPLSDVIKLHTTNPEAFAWCDGV
jgi:hypothetical protein